MRSPSLHALLERALDTSAEPGATFAIVPAAVRNHHAYRHGLLEHSLIVAEVAGAVAERFDTVNRDLTVAGALLHDIGKVHSYSADPMAPGFTDAGRLHGEIVIGHDIVRGLIDEIPDFPAEMAAQLRHIVVSHHGEREKGSPVVPATREAVIVHFCDDMTARLAAIDEIAGRTAAERTLVGLGATCSTASRIWPPRSTAHPSVAAAPRSEPGSPATTAPPATTSDGRRPRRDDAPDGERRRRADGQRRRRRADRRGALLDRRDRQDRLRGGRRPAGLAALGLVLAHAPQVATPHGTVATPAPDPAARASVALAVARARRPRRRGRGWVSAAGSSRSASSSALRMPRSSTTSGTDLPVRWASLATSAAAS